MLRCLVALSVGSLLLPAQDLFQFTTRNFSDYAATLLGNGYLLGATSWNGAAAATSALAGVYDNLQAGSYPYQALIPAWNEVDYFNGCTWLNQARPGDLRLAGYVQTLDARRGLLSTRYDWIDCNRTTHIEVTAFPARHERQLSAVRFSVTPDYGVTAGPVTISFPVGGPAEAGYVWEGAKLPGPVPITRVEPDPDGRGFIALSETRDHKVQVAQALRIHPDPNLRPYEVLAGVSLEDPQHPSVNLKFIAVQGQTYTFVKFVATVSSLDTNRIVEKARALALDAERSGYASLIAAHEKAWDELWTADIRIQGDVEAQRAIHAAMFYLFSSVRSDTDTSIPAVAVPSRAYLGRVWWDADTFVFPSLLVLNPGMARSLVSYRCARLAQAQQNAKMRGYRGALFPMQSAATGSEAAPEWSNEIHVTGDVAMAQWRYFLGTGDAAWLRECGYPVLRDVADFWASRATYVDRTGQYEIRDVTGPNEAVTHVDDNAYTNALARRVLETASEAASRVGVSANPEWARIAPKIALSFDPQKKRHLEHAGDFEGKYAHTVPMMSYPLDMGFPDEVKRNDLDLALRNFGKPGYEVGMLGNFYSVVASELGDGDLAYRLFLDAMRSYAKPPFYAMSETPSNNRFVFLTAEGAFLQQVIFGFTGLRFSGDGLSPRFRPVLPRAWQSLELRGINLNGKRHTVRIQQGGKLVIQ
jgi:trehalose/maltose hydrolase-like predicted phosphorylase